MRERNMTILIWLILFQWTTNLISQPIEPVPSNRIVTLAKNDSIFEFSILINKKNKDLPVDLNKKYHWYAFDRLHSNAGSFEGNLLHGKCSIYDEKYNLIVQGNFSYGLKHGLWLEWNNKGELISSVEWSKGYRNGTSKEYNAGQLTRISEYKNDQLHGSTIIYTNGEKKEELKYKRGHLVTKDEKKSSNLKFLKNLFRGKNKRQPKDSLNQTPDKEGKIENNTDGTLP